VVGMRRPAPAPVAKPQSVPAARTQPTLGVSTLETVRP